MLSKPPIGKIVNLLGLASAYIYSGIPRGEGIVMVHKLSYAELERRIAELEQQVEVSKNLEKALRESEERYRKLAEFSPIPIIVHSDGKIVFINSEAVRILGGASIKDFLGKSVFSVVHPDFIKIAKQRVSDIYSKVRNADIIEEKFIRLDGTPIDVEVMGNIVDYQGKPSSQVVFRDITEKKKLEAQLSRAHKMEAIGTLAGGIAHDFNNILSAVIGYTEMAIDDTPDLPEVQANLKEVLTAGMRARDLVKQILTFSRQVRQEPKPIRLDKLVDDSLRLLRASFPATIKMERNFHTTSSVLADPTQMHQVIMNLATNAVYEMQDSGGLLEIGLVNVWLDTSFKTLYPGISPGEYVKLSVCDTGYGMTPEVRERIFDPFFTTKAKGEGAGMGLAVVHGIVKEHGGVITVDSEPGRGAVFNIFLPVLDAEAGVEEEDLADLPVGTEHILFVDDEPALADLGKVKLERLGYTVTATSSGVEALELFRARPRDYDLVITDLTMPDITGDILAHRIKELSPEAHVILCSGYTYQIPEAKKQEMEVDALISKPVVILELAQTIRTVLDNPSP